MQKADPEAKSTPETRNSLMQLLTKKFKLCWEVYQSFREESSLDSLLPKTMRMILDSAIKAEDLKAAVEIFRDMQSQHQPPTMISWCYLISSLNKVRRRGWSYADTAYQLWKELTTREELHQERDGFYYATGMTACTGVGRLKEAEELIETMTASGIKPDIRAYNILLTGYSRNLDLGRVEEIFDKLKRRGVQPSASTYNILMNANIEANLHSKAQQLVRQATEAGIQPDLHMYSTLIKGAVKQGDLQSAVSVYNDMLQNNVEPSVVTINTLLDGHVRANQMGEAEGLVRAMEERGTKSNVVVYNTLLRGYARSGQTQAVKEVLQRMMKAGISLREDTFNTLMTAALENNDTQVVPNLFSQLLSLNLRPDSLSYTSLITALSRLSRPEAAIDAAVQLEQQGGLDIIAINALVAALASGDRLVEAEDYLKKAVDLSHNKGLPPPIEAYGALVKAYARLNDATAALDLLAEFQQEGGRPDERMISMGVTACVRAGEFRRALKFVRAMEKAGKNVDKARIKITLETVVRLQEKYYRERSKLYPKNENLERFKFWLGLPNQYYPSDEYDSFRSIDESNSFDEGI